MESLNVHPIFVHFPIALLTLYAFFEIVRLPFIARQQWCFPLKAIMLFAGVLGGFAAMQTGEWAEDIFRGTPTMELVRLHSTFANATMWVYGILAVIYLMEWMRRGDVTPWLPSGMRKIWNHLVRIETTLFNAPLLMLGSLAGLVLITITGALGGAITYGPEVDPVVSFIYGLFF